MDLPVEFTFTEDEHVVRVLCPKLPKDLVPTEVVSLERAGKLVEFRVTERRLVIADDGSARWSIALEPRVFKLDALAARHPGLGELLQSLLPALLLVVIAAAGLAVYLFIHATSESRLALAGWLIAKAPLLIFCLGAIGAPVLSSFLEKRTGRIVSVTLGMSGAGIGFVLAALWEAAFIPTQPHAWPQDFAQLTRDFQNTGGAAWALASLYLPTVVIVLKALKWSNLAELLSSKTKRGSSSE